MRKSTFGKKAAHKVGNFEGDQESIGATTGAKKGCQRDVTQQTEDSGKQGHAAHNEGGLQQLGAQFRAPFIMLCGFLIKYAMKGAFYRI